MVYEILVPPPAIQHRALALEAQSLHWMAREDSQQTFFSLCWNRIYLKYFFVKKNKTKQNKMLSLAFSTYPGHCNGL